MRLIAASGLFVAVVLSSCGGQDGGQVRLDSNQAAPTQEPALSQTAAAWIERIPDGPRVVYSRGCSSTTVKGYNNAEEAAKRPVTQPIVGLPDALAIWICDFDVVFDHPQSGPYGSKPPSWPAGGLEQVARVALLGNGEIVQTNFYEGQPPSAT